MFIRGTFAGAAVSALLLASSVQAQENYPAPVVKLITHSSPGGGSDVFLR